MNDKLELIGVDHIAIAAENVDALAEWYCDVLCYKKYHRHDKPVWILQAPDMSLIEVMPRDENGRPKRTTWTPGWSHLALRVKNIYKAIDYLDTINVNWGGELTQAIGGGLVRTFYDPEGNMLQLVERDLEING